MKINIHLDLFIQFSFIILLLKLDSLLTFDENLLLKHEKVCKTIDIRRLSHLTQLQNCTVIEGDLYIASLTLFPSETFPLLKEITGCLVIYYVHGIKTLETYFPNLVVIRGQTLAYNYAVVIKETNLWYIGLVNLRLIALGGVRIDNNPSLCYISSINWKNIVNETGAPIKTINMRNICPDFCHKSCKHSNSQKVYCWSHKTCQNVCSVKCSSQNMYCFMNNTDKCCHPECLGGCYGDGDDKCVSCKNVMSDGRCVKKCEKSFYKYKNRRCISKSECREKFSQSTTDYRRRDRYAIEDDACVKNCSSGKQRNEKSGLCEVCGSNCSKKYCGKVLIHSINDLQEIDGCYSAEEIRIEIKEGGSTLSELLMNKFSKLTVIENSLEIVSSSSITSLNFLRSLRLIKGNLAKNNNQNSSLFDKESKIIVFNVYDNENLVELFNDKMPGNQLNISILHGSLSFNLNRKLCPEKIITFLNTSINSSVKLSALEQKIINLTNGDMAFCKHEKLIVKVKSIQDTFFTAVCKSKLKNVLLQDIAFSALLMIKETQNNVSQYELYNSCSEQSWRSVEVSLGKPVKVTGLKPATRYAFYVEAIRSRAENWLEISDVLYLTTNRKYPSPPVNIKLEPLSDSEMRLTWNPPLFPNGNITRYLIWFRSFEISHKEFILDEVCFHHPYTQKPYKRNELKLEAVKNKQANSNHLTCDCNSCMEMCNQNKETLNGDKENFDFQLPDHYLSQSFQKQVTIPISNWSPKISDDFEINKNNEPVITEETTTFAPPQNPDIQNWSILKNSSNRFLRMVEVPANINFFIFTNLHHYTEYLFEIQACQNPDDGNFLNSHENTSTDYTLNVLSKTCSLRSPVSSHTFPKDKMDDIDHITINSFVVENSVKIYWQEPMTPNGLILNFFLRYGEVPYENTVVKNMLYKHNWLDTLCITRSEWLVEKNLNTNETNSSDGINSNGNYSSNGNVLLNQPQSGSYILRNLRFGRYEYQIKPISIPSNGSWTKSIYFNISSNTEKYQTVFIVGSIAVVVLICILIIVVYYYYKKKYLAKTKWVSSNPDYWIIYEIDEWEIDRKDIDMIEWIYPLGRGSFGMVYKGILKNLTTPARHQLSNKSIKDVSVAVKTLNANSTILERREFINEACYMKQFQSYHLVQLFGIVSKINHSLTNKQKNPCYTFCSKFTFVKRFKNLKTRISWNLANRIRIFKSSNSKHSNRSDEVLEDLTSAQLVSFKTTISQHFQKMPLVIMELMEFGDLAGYLRKQGEEGEGFVSETQSYLWALQIADGMLYLSVAKFIHRDLAARNCMINDALIIKIGDFGMARDIYYECYYRKHGKGRLPVRWTAPESLLSAYFTTSSDVWSYGVVLWEISTLASLPYRGMSHTDVIKYVTNGGTLVSNGSYNSSKLLLNVMESCWQYKADSRPTFNEIVFKLEHKSDENFRANSYHFQQKFVTDLKQDMAQFDSELDIEYSIDNCINDL